MSPGPAPRTVDYYFSLVSPWAYIGHAMFTGMLQRRGAGIRHVPVSLSTVFPESGGLPLLKRHPSRQRYRMVELQRWREKRSLSFHLRPRFWPFDAALADRVVLALAESGADLERFLPAAFKGVWEDERDLGDPAVLEGLLRQGGFDAAEVMASAQSDAVAALYAWNAERALDAGVFGSPSYVLSGEVFWGQDRLDLLDDALACRREPFRG